MTGLNPSILVVENDELMGQIIKDSLSQFFEDIAITPNGREALEAFEQKIPDIIISDINMPELNGLEMLRSIRAQGADCPVILMSSFKDSDTLIEAMKLGVCDFLEKPFLNNELLRSVYRVIEMATREKKIEELEAAGKFDHPELIRHKKFVGLLKVLRSYQN